MTNGEKFLGIFGRFATEIWALSEAEFLNWLNEEYEMYESKLTFQCAKCGRVYADHAELEWDYDNNRFRWIAKCPDCGEENEYYWK